MFDCSIFVPFLNIGEWFTFTPYKYSWTHAPFHRNDKWRNFFFNSQALSLCWHWAVRRNAKWQKKKRSNLFIWPPSLVTFAKYRLLVLPTSLPRPVGGEWRENERVRGEGEGGGRLDSRPRCGAGWRRECIWVWCAVFARATEHFIAVVYVFESSNSIIFGLCSHCISHLHSSFDCVIPELLLFAEFMPLCPQLNITRLVFKHFCRANCLLLQWTAIE